MKIEINRVADLIRMSDNIYILAHQSPDGDTIGSSLALYYFLKQLGKTAKVLCADEFSNKYNYIKESYVDEEFDCDTVITVDVADTQLLGSLQEKFGEIINLSIDHHISNTDYAKYTFVNPDAAATCEILYGIIKYMGGEITPKIAECLYTGIVTDTGCFKFSNTTAETHRIVADIMEVPFEYAVINRNMFEIKPIQRIRLEMQLISQMESYFDGKCHLVVVSQALLKEMGLVPSDLEGITAITTQVQGVEVGIVIKEKEPGIYKISLRSTGDINVSEICTQLGGGGHIRAAGCTLRGTEDFVKETIINAIAYSIHNS